MLGEAVMAGTSDNIAQFSMRFLGHVLIATIAAMGVALIAAQMGGAVAAIGIGLTILLAAFGLGAGFGFLFAVPRVASQPSPEAKQQAGGKSVVARFLQSNTNLEKISDWLTTMLVGVGLSQLYQVNDALVRFRTSIELNARVFADGTAGPLPVLSPFLLLFGLIAGFLFMYLHTRVDLVRLFDQVEGLLSGESQRDVASAVRAAEQAGASLPPDTDTARPTVDDALNAMFDLLYKPDGYREVIRIGATLANTPATKKAQYWFYLAAAYGQQHLGAAAANNSAAAQTARANALDAGRRAVAIDPSYRARLWHISNPEGGDNDLSGLRSDPEFLSLVGR
jgi:hypothetical protein